MKNFWNGFLKKAEAGTGGSGHSGLGKGNLSTGYSEQGGMMGNSTQSGAEDTRTDKTLLDRQRNPKDFAVGRHGQDEPADSNPHIIY